jgi:hypothetical protein
MANKTWDTQIERIKQSEAEYLALKREIARQENTPRGQAQLEVDRLQAQFGQREKERGTAAMAEAKRIHAASPHVPVEVAFNNMVTNRKDDGLTLEQVMRMAETMSPAELEAKFDKDYADDPSGLLHAHRLAGRALRVKQASSRVPELKAEVRKLKVQYPGRDTHWYHAIAASNLGIK